jgi:hypothetical protein
MIRPLDPFPYPVHTPPTSIFSFILVPWGGVRLSPSGTSGTIWALYQPRMMDDDEHGTAGGMSDRGNRSTRRKPTSVPLCPPQIQYDLTLAATRIAAVVSQRLTA